MMRTKISLTRIATLLLTQLATSHAATPSSDKAKLDITYKTTSQTELGHLGERPDIKGLIADFPKGSLRERGFN
jgi:hypothetical protein